MTDEELRADMAEGLTPSQIGKKHGLSRQAATRRYNRMKLTLSTVAMVTPTETRRFVTSNIDILEELALSLRRVNLLSDACDAWLRDVDDPTRYDVGPRAHELQVTYLEPQSDGPPVKKKESLQSLLDRVAGGGLLATWSESKTADPRQLILNTQQEVRQTVVAAAELARMLADAQSMQRFREALLAAIGRVSPEVADQIAAAIRPVLVLRAATE